MHTIMYLLSKVEQELSFRASSIPAHVRQVRNEGTSVTEIIATEAAWTKLVQVRGKEAVRVLIEYCWKCIFVLCRLAPTF
jgi:hypothetical protein